MKVWLLNKDAVEIMVRNAIYAALTCTGNEYKIVEKFPEHEVFLKSIIDKGHESVLEHINLTFRIEDISRALLQELARHRHISLSVQSTRNALKRLAHSDFLFGALQNILVGVADALPESVPYTEKERSNMDKLDKMAERALSIFYLLSVFDKDSSAFVPDVVKYYLPECMPTSLILTVNVRELRHIFKLRSRPEALLEFRRLVKALYDAIPEKFRYLFTDVMHEGVFSLPEIEDIEDDDDDDEE